MDIGVARHCRQPESLLHHDDAESVHRPYPQRAQYPPGAIVGHGRETVRLRIRFGYACAAACLATVLALTLFQPQRPRDTFDNPVEALAQLEKTFSYISGKTGKGLDLAEKSVSIIDRPAQMISEIQNK